MAVSVEPESLVGLHKNGANCTPISLKDDLYHSTAEGGTQYFRQLELRDYLRSLEV
jgi:hypothetical protein